VLWEKWHLVERTRHPLLLEDLLGAMPAETGLVLDLKGPDPRMAARVLRATAEWRASRPLFVCGRVWRTLDRMRGHTGVQTFHSAGSPRQLRALLRRPPRSLEGASVDRRLLTRALVEKIRARAPALWAWGVNDPETASELAGWGVTGMISDYPGALRDPLMRRSASNELPATARHPRDGSADEAGR
jgi:glycerophosphoryl diester phosphodiesterase